MSQELVTYIVLGSNQRLKNIKIPSSTKVEEYLLSNFDDNNLIVKTIDSLVSNAKGNLVVLLPPSSLPNKKSKEILKKISMIDFSAWGWFQFNKKNNDFIRSYMAGLKVIEADSSGRFLIPKDLLVFGSILLGP